MDIATETTVYQVARGTIISEHESLAAAIAAAQDGDEIYMECRSGKYRSRGRVWPTEGRATHWMI